MQIGFRYLAFSLAYLFSQVAMAQKGPDIELAPEDSESPVPLQSPLIVGDAPPAAIKKTGLFALPRQSQIDIALDPRTNRLRGAAVGGYGEAVLNAPLGQNAPVVADLRRTILFFGFNFTDRIRFFSEIEFEHALTTSGKQGEVAVEQAFLDFMLLRWLNLRAGMILMPVSLVNIYHEPSTFHGVDRPDVDLRIVPSTWKQLGAGFFGAVGPVRYQLYVTPGLKAENFSAQTGVRGGVQDNFVRARDWGVVGRFDWAPFLGANLGLSLFAAGAGQGDVNLGAVPVFIGATDATVTRFGFSLRAQLSYIYIGDGVPLNQTLFLITPSAGPVAEHLLGGYGEVAYDVLRRVSRNLGMQLWVFGRYERTNTQFRVPQAPLLPPPQTGADQTVYTAGLTLRPIFEIAIKLDYQYRHSEIPQSGANFLNAGLAYQF